MTRTEARRAAATGNAAEVQARSWWLLVHQLPPDPPGLRMQVWRRLQALGALALKGAVYVLPATDTAREDLQWLLGEIRSGGGEGTLWRASGVDGLDDDDLVLRFQAAAGAEYDALATDLEALRKAWGKRARPPADGARKLARLAARFADVGARDHFAAPRREIVGALLQSLQQQVEPAPATSRAAAAHGTLDAAAYRGRTWITRAHVHVDRMASAWLIRRFIDPDARFAFAADDLRAPVPGALRFDTYGGEFTHEGDLCTFEVLARRFGLRAPGLERIAQLVHDIDLKDGRYGHAEAAGLAASLDAISDAAADDDARLALAGTVFDGLFKRYGRAA